jgi:hypothetical protein
MNNLRYKVGLDGLSQLFSVHIQSLGHLETPMIPNLSAQIQVELSNQESVFDPRQALKFPPLHVFNDFVKTDRRSRSVGGRDVTRPVKLSEIFVRRLAVS